MRVGLERQNVLFDEGADADAQAFDLGLQCEVHDVPLLYPRIATTWPPSHTTVVPAM